MPLNEQQLYNKLKRKLTHIRQKSAQTPATNSQTNDTVDIFSIQAFEERKRTIIKTRHKTRIQFFVNKFGLFQIFDNVIFFSGRTRLQFGHQRFMVNKLSVVGFSKGPQKTLVIQKIRLILFIF